MPYELVENPKTGNQFTVEILAPLSDDRSTGSIVYLQIHRLGKERLLKTGIVLVLSGSNAEFSGCIVGKNDKGFQDAWRSGSFYWQTLPLVDAETLFNIVAALQAISNENKQYRLYSNGRQVFIIEEDLEVEVKKDSKDTACASEKKKQSCAAGGEHKLAGSQFPYTSGGTDTIFQVCKNCRCLVQVTP